MISKKFLFIIIGELSFGFVALTIVVIALYYTQLYKGKYFSFSPHEHGYPLANPLTGYIPWGDLVKPFPQAFGTIFMLIRWREVEWIQGQYQWEALEEKNQFSRWKLSKKKLVIRMVLDSPDFNGDFDLPPWIINMILKDGTNYYLPNKGSGFSPNYANTDLIREHQIFIQAVAARYATNPMLVSVQVGSLGIDGEWVPAPNTEWPDSIIANQYIQHYIDAFPKDVILQLPFPFQGDWSKGVHVNILGNKQKVDEMVEAINSGVFTSAAGKEYQANSGHYWSGIWSGRFETKDYLQYFDGNAIINLEEQIKNLHISYIGPENPADEYLNSTYQKNIEQLSNLMGYRFVLKEISHAKFAAYGESLELILDVKNVGIAPFYLDWQVEASLYQKGKLRYTMLTSARPKSWGIGDKTVKINVDIPSNVIPLKYILCFAIVDKNNTPAVNFAIYEGQMSDGRYCYGEIEIRKPKLSRTSVILIGVSIGLVTIASAVVTFFIGKRMEASQPVAENLGKTNPGTTVRSIITEPMNSKNTTPDAKPELNTEVGEKPAILVSPAIQKPSKPKRVLIIN